MSQEIFDRLSSQGYSLPEASRPNYAYEATMRFGNLLYVSGQIPRRDGVVLYTGAVGRERSIDEGISAAELCALNVLAQVESAVGLKAVAALLKLNGYVASAPDFYQQPLVIDGASKLLRHTLGANGGHARTALGVTMLPANSLVEIDAVFALTDG